MRRFEEDDHHHQDPEVQTLVVLSTAHGKVGDRMDAYGAEEDQDGLSADRVDLDAGASSLRDHRDPQVDEIALKDA